MAKIVSKYFEIVCVVDFPIDSVQRWPCRIGTVELYYTTIVVSQDYSFCNHDMIAESTTTSLFKNDKNITKFNAPSPENPQGRQHLQPKQETDLPLQP
jgi:hypothetical protein